jgi:hypothetical protein
MRLEVKDSAELAVLDQPQKLAQRRKEPFVGADPQHHPSLSAGIDRAHRVGLVQGQRLLAEDRLSCLCDSNDLVSVQRMRRRDHDRVDAAVGDHRGGLGDELESVLGRKVAVRFGVAADRAGKVQPIASALNRLDKGLAPPAETDDRGVDHRPAKLA